MLKVCDLGAPEKPQSPGRDISVELSLSYNYVRRADPKTDRANDVIGFYVFTADHEPFGDTSYPRSSLIYGNSAASGT